MEKLLLAELARQVGLTETTARRYLKNFREYFNPEKDGQRALYTTEDGHVLKQIATLYGQGLTTEQVKTKLLEDHTTTIDAVVEVTPPLSERAIAAQERLALALGELVDQKNKLMELDQKSNTQDKHIQELKEEVAALRQQMEQTTRGEHPSIPWWKKIFRKG